MQNIAQLEYVGLLFLLADLPILLIWTKYGNYLKKYIKVHVYCVLFSLLFGVPWDIWAVKSDMWNYESNHILGIWFLGIPIEEYFYIVTVAFLFTTITLLLRKYIKQVAR
jgi:lycopene cyclase domain-containing protein